MESQRKISYDQNDQPPKNYIWYKNGQYLEWNGSKWTVSEGLNNKDEITENMTQEQQMQARKNLGLYYEEPGTEEKTAQYNNEPESATLSGYAKISDDTPAKEDIVAVQGSFGSGGEIVFDDTSDNDGFGVGMATDPVAIRNLFIVITDNSAGHELGIYVQLNTILFLEQKLVYNGPVTVVSKVDEKYLPIAWNQVVTEGTKIAEVTIGEETTNVFGGGVYVAHASRDFYESAFADLSTLFSNPEDITAVMSGNASVIEIDDTEIKYSFLGKKSGYVYYVSGNKILSLSGSGQYAAMSFYEIYTGTIPGPVFLSGLPDSSMTTQAELDAIGLTLANINKLASGEATAIIYQNPFIFSKSSLGILYVNGPATSAPNTYSLSFRDYTNVYNISSLSASQITVTVTPLS